MQIAELVKKQEKKLGYKPAIIFQNSPISFQELSEQVFNLTKSLYLMGVKPQDKVGVYLSNCPEYIYTYFALFSLGATVVPLDYMLTQDEISACLNHCEAKYLIARPKNMVVIKNLKNETKSLQEIVLFEDQLASLPVNQLKSDQIPLIGQSAGQKDVVWLPMAKATNRQTGKLNKEGFLNFTDLLKSSHINFIPAAVKEEDLAMILYTSGTTGRPKGVELTYKHLYAIPMSMEHFVDLNERDVKICALPFSHIGGFMYILNSLCYGITLVLMERFIPLQFLENVAKYRVSCFHLVPSMYYAILQLKEFEKFDLSSIRWVNVFGAPNSPDMLRRFHEYCPKASFLNGWGLTETVGPCVVTPLGEEKLESVGKLAPWSQIKIIDENNHPLPVGQTGEIILQSWVVMKGYYNDPEATQEVIRDGWFYTGDLGKFDQDGYLYILGRKREVIKVSGELVYASEVESALSKHPQVREVAVIGVSDKLRGETIKAVVSLKLGATVNAQEIKIFSKEHLAHFKVPHIVEIRQELPKTRTGKIDKTQLG